MTINATLVDSPPPISTIHLSYEGTSAREARRWAREVLAGLVGDETIDAVRHCVAELVANSQVHTRPNLDRGEITCHLMIGMTRGVSIRVEVIDAGSPGKEPTSRRVGADDESGRGLSQVVDGYADAWGHEQRSPHESVTWFVVNDSAGDRANECVLAADGIAGM
jgi:anti-sigma regulatory factor (Ser/Thr protein kinase)